MSPRKTVLLHAAAAALVVLGGLSARAGDPEHPAVDRCVGAYYYPWCFPERWTREPVTGAPRLGPSGARFRGVLRAAAAAT